MKNVEFHRALRKRGCNVTKLATLCGVGRAHLTQVLNGSRTGPGTWRKLAKALTHQEYLLAGGPKLL